MKNNLPVKLQRLLSKLRKVPLHSIKEKNIDYFLRKLDNVSWRPHLLFEHSKSKIYLAFTYIHDAEVFPNYLSLEIEKAQKICNIDFYFILGNESLLDIFEGVCREKGFGIILIKNDDPKFIRDPIKAPIARKATYQYAGHFPLWTINEIKEITLGTPKFRTVLRDFSKEYFRLKSENKSNWQDEEESLVKNTIAGILQSNPKYTFGIDSIEILKRFESFFTDIRDHYFHSFHIFLLGLLILDHYQDDFNGYYKTIFPKYNAFSIEFLWLLTSIFHDIGYSISYLDNLKEKIYGVPTISTEKETANVWNDPIYQINLKQLTSLLSFSISDIKHRNDWRPDIFGTQDDPLERLFRDSFFDSHGVAGCFRFLVDIFAEARREKDEDKRIFLVNHIYPAALSVALHDGKFREKLSQAAGIKRIKLSRFPFAVLLIYLDNIQEDKRDKFLCIESPELLKGFKYNHEIIAVIDEKLAKTYPRLGKLRAECKSFLDFVECDGIKFEYPQVLSI